MSLLTDYPKGVVRTLSFRAHRTRRHRAGCACQPRSDPVRVRKWSRGEVRLRPSGQWSLRDCGNRLGRRRL